MRILKKVIVKLSTLIMFWGLIGFYFCKVWKETSSFTGWWTVWTLDLLFAVIVVLGIGFSIWIISGKNEKEEEVQEVEQEEKKQ